MTLGFTFNGLHSERDIGVSLVSDPQINYPNKIKIQHRLTGTNKIYDFSAINGIQQYEERTIEVQINIIGYDRKNYASTQLVATRVANWLMAPNEKKVLTIDRFPEYYFLAEVVDLGDLELNLFKFGIANVTFQAHPFKIATNRIGDDNFREFIFPLDVRQRTSYDLKVIEDQMPFNVLKIGDIVNIGGWAQYYVNPEGVSRYDKMQQYMIEDVREVDDVDPSILRFDKTQYYLSEINSWVRSQDIIQARSDYTVASMTNIGVNPITPEIDITVTNRRNWDGITIERDGVFYDIRRNHPNTLFDLNIGTNDIKIYGQGVSVDFKWRNEVL